MSAFAEMKVDGHSDRKRLMPIGLRRFGCVALLCFVVLSTAGKAAAQGQSAADGLLAKGMALKGAGELGGAAAFAEAITLNPKQANAHNLLGAACEKLGRPSQAIREFDAARQLEPSSREFAYNLALAYYQAGFFSRAIATIQEAPSSAPKTAEFYRLLGDAEVGADQYVKGVRDLRKSVALDPSESAGFYDLGIAILKSASDRDALA